MAWASAWFDFRNFLLAGVLKNKSLTDICVPLLALVASFSLILPPSKTILRPIRASSVFVSISSFETAAIDARASPLNPKDSRDDRSSTVFILLVAVSYTHLTLPTKRIV